METVAVTLTRRYAWITSADDATYAKLEDFWSYQAPGSRYAPSFKVWLRNKAIARREGDPYREVYGWDGKIKLLKNGKLPAGLFRATKLEAAKKLSVGFDVTYDRPAIPPFEKGFDEASDLYQFQNDCVEAMCKAMRRGGGVVLSATGTGKTKASAQFFSKLSCPVLFIVDRIDLLYQSQQEMAHWLGEPVGIVGDSEFAPERVTIGTIQTLSLHAKKSAFKKWFATIKVLLVDELHKAMGKRNFKLLNQIKLIAIYGLTATLQMGQKPVRYRVYAFSGPVIFRFPVKEGMEKGVLTKGRVLQLLFPALEDEARDPAIAYVEETVDHTTKLLAARRIVDSLIDQDRYVMVLVDRVAHVKALDEILHDIPHEIAYGAIAQKKRKRDRDRFELGKIRCLVANRVYEKGINLKRVDVGIDLAELPSPNDCVQKFGRMARLHEDKANFLYVDFGTYGPSRRSKAASARARAFRKEGMEVKVVKLDVERKYQASMAQKIVDKEIQKDELIRVRPTQQSFEGFGATQTRRTGSRGR